MDEGNVVDAVMAHFKAQGFEVVQGFQNKPRKSTDLLCNHADGSRWKIEAKGSTKNMTTDFNTGLGQLLKGMSEPQANYGLALPEIAAYVSQAKKVPGWVRSCLKLHFIFVTETKAIQFLGPDD